MTWIDEDGRVGEGLGEIGVGCWERGFRDQRSWLQGLEFGWNVASGRDFCEGVGAEVKPGLRGGVRLAGADASLFISCWIFQSDKKMRTIHNIGEVNENVATVV